MGNNKKTKEIIIGREGTQPFPIFNTGVSRRHAKVTVNEDTDEWVIEDVGSDHGTYILNGRGNWVKVKSPTPIDEKTIIRLGKEYGYGVRFMAHRLIANDPKDFRYEFHIMRIHNERIDRGRKGLKNRELFRVALLVVAVGVAFVPESMFPSQYLNGVVNRLAILIPGLVAGWVGWQGKRDRENLDNQQEVYSVCPNPQCNHQLDKSAQKQLGCPKCRAKYAYIPENANLVAKNQ